MASLLLVLDCPECRGPREFETPPCADGHDDCPELGCTGCGAAVMVALPWPTAEREPVLARTA